MENLNIQNSLSRSIARQPPLEQLLAVRLDLESRRRQEAELKARDNDKLLDKMDKMAREQETRERTILALRRRVRDEYVSEESNAQLAVAERTVRLLEKDMLEMGRKNEALQQELCKTQQSLLDKRLELNQLNKLNFELDVKVDKLEKKVKKCWAEEDRLIEELHIAGDRIASFEQENLESGFDSFNKVAALEESLRLLITMDLCKDLVYECVIDALDHVASTN